MMTLSKSFFVVFCLLFFAWLSATPALAKMKVGWMVECRFWNTSGFFSQDKIFDSSSFLSVAYAKSIPKSGVKGASIIPQIIKGILGK